MSESKSIFKSKTIWGILGTIVTASAVPAYDAYRETKNIEDVIGAILPVLVATALPGAIAVDGRIRANKNITFR